MVRGEAPNPTRNPEEKRPSKNSSETSWMKLQGRTSRGCEAGADIIYFGGDAQWGCSGHGGDAHCKVSKYIMLTKLD